MENLFHKSKLAHSMRSLSLNPEEKKIINMEDINLGMTFFNNEVKTNIDNELLLMYS